MKKNFKAHLTEGSVPCHLFSLTWPGISGSLAITVFNLTDTFFVSRLGTDSLAAMGFTFPIILIINSVAMGISMGSGSVLSRALGSGDHHLMKRTSTDGIMLSVFIVGIISLTGLLSLDTFFRLMGASGEVLKLTKDYMFIWYLGAVATIVPPVSDSCLRATGDMIRPLIVMVVIAVMNGILDPILIFGFFGLPAMGIKGAALATVISRFIGLIATLGFLHFHAGLVDLSRPSLKEIRESWHRILRIGLPSALTQLLPHLTRGIITRLAAGAGGAAAVAALAAGTRIESLGVVLIGAYSMALVPMVGQNWGAEKWMRIREIRKITFRMSFIYGFIVFSGALLLAGPAALIFTKDPAVIPITMTYLRLMGAAAFSLALYTWTGQMLNSAGIPRPAAQMNISGSLLILALAFIGSVMFGITGLIIGMAAGQISIAGIAIYVDRKYLNLT